MTASITNEADDELRLAAGRTVYAVIKASDVMVGLDQPAKTMSTSPKT